MYRYITDDVLKYVSLTALIFHNDSIVSIVHVILCVIVIVIIILQLLYYISETNNGDKHHKLFSTAR